MNDFLFQLFYLENSAFRTISKVARCCPTQPWGPVGPSPRDPQNFLAHARRSEPDMERAGEGARKTRAPHMEPSCLFGNRKIDRGPPWGETFKKSYEFKFFLNYLKQIPRAKINKLKSALISVWFILCIILFMFAYLLDWFCICLTDFVFFDCCWLCFIFFVTLYVIWWVPYLQINEFSENNCLAWLLKNELLFSPRSPT